MANYVVFYLDKFLNQYSGWSEYRKALIAGDVPEGSHLCIAGENQRWYRIQWGSRVSLNDCDVPLTLKTYMMLLG